MKLYLLGILFVLCFSIASAADVSVTITVPAGCGDGTCQPAFGETTATCAVDCPAGGLGGGGGGTVIPSSNETLNSTRLMIYQVYLRLENGMNISGNDYVKQVFYEDQSRFSDPILEFNELNISRGDVATVDLVLKIPKEFARESSWIHIWRYSNIFWSYSSITNATSYEPMQVWSEVAWHYLDEDADNWYIGLTQYNSIWSMYTATSSSVVNSNLVYFVVISSVIVLIGTFWLISFLRNRRILN